MKFRFWQKQQVEAIRKTPRDYALEMHGVIAGLRENEKDAALYSLIRLVHPTKHLHENPRRKVELSTNAERGA